MAARVLVSRAGLFESVCGRRRGNIINQLSLGNISCRTYGTTLTSRRLALLGCKGSVGSVNSARAGFSVSACVRSSQEVSKDASSLSTDYIPAPPEIPAPVDPESLAEGLNALGEASMASMGLATYTPAGLVRQGLEFMHVNLDLPWAGAIMLSMYTAVPMVILVGRYSLGAVLVRVILFPLIVKSQRDSVNMQRHMPTITALNQRVQDAKNRQDYLEMQRLAKDLADYTSRNKVNPLAMFGIALIQAPIFLAIFPGLRSMCNYPVESMQTGGFSWFTDLTVYDPYYILPAFTAGTLLLIIEIGADGVKAKDVAQRNQTVVLWVMRALPFASFLITMSFPAGMCLYWCTTNSISLLQTSLLKLKPVRQHFNIPERIQHPLLKKKSPTKGPLGFLTDAKQSYNSMKDSYDIDRRSRVNAARYKSAGIAPIQKTFKANPKLQQIVKEKSL